MIRPNFKALVDHIVEAYPERIAIRMRFPDREGYDEWSYARLHQAVLQCANFLVGQGIEKGDRVAILSENRPEWCADAGVQGAFLSAAQRGKIDGLLKVEGSLEWIVLFDGEAERAPGVFALSDLLSRPRTAALPSAAEIEPADAASIIFTSGTTGVAKGVVLSHGGIIANINAAIHSLYIDKDDVFMTVLPLYHTYTTTCSSLSPLTVAGAASPSPNAW